MHRTLLAAIKTKASDPILVSETGTPVVQRFDEQPRAQRFTIHAPLRYRALDGDWQEGTILNISESGVLFQANQTMLSTPAIEMRFSLSTGVSGEVAAQVACRGAITRAVSSPGGQTVLAARIGKFHFGRSGRSPVV